MYKSACFFIHEPCEAFLELVAVRVNACGTLRTLMATALMGVYLELARIKTSFLCATLDFLDNSLFGPHRSWLSRFEHIIR